VPVAEVADVPNVERLGRVLLASGKIVKSQRPQNRRRASDLGSCPVLDAFRAWLRSLSESPWF